MTHLKLAKEKLARIEKRLRFCKGQVIPYDQDPAEELRRLNRRREEVAEAEFDLCELILVRINGGNYAKDDMGASC